MKHHQPPFQALSEEKERGPGSEVGSLAKVKRELLCFGVGDEICLKTTFLSHKGYDAMISKLTTIFFF